MPINTTSNQNLHASRSNPTCDPFKNKELSLKPLYYHCIWDILLACSNVVINDLFHTWQISLFSGVHTFTSIREFISLLFSLLHLHPNGCINFIANAGFNQF